MKTGEALIGAIDRMQQMVLANPALLARLELLPAEKMLAAIDPGYQALEVSARLDTHMTNGHARFVQYNADSPTGAGYADALADLFFDAPPVKEFRKKYTLTRVGSRKHLLQALLKSYKQFGGAKQPNIAIVEFRSAYHSGQSEFELFRDCFREEGYAVEIVSPEQLEYRNGVLRKGAFEIDLVYRRLGVQEFLIRFDLTHPLVRAYRDRAVCVVNSFRSELAHKKAMFGLLTDETLTAKFPAAERKAIREHVPWTRLVAAAKTSYGDRVVDLPEFITQNRERLALKPNDDYSDQHSLLRLGDGRRFVGPRPEAGHAHAVRGAGARGARPLGIPADDLRPPGIPRNAGGRAPARLPGQGTGLFELAFHGQGGVHLRGGNRAHVSDRSEVGSAFGWGPKNAGSKTGGRPKGLAPQSTSAWRPRASPRRSTGAGCIISLCQLKPPTTTPT